MKAFSRPHNVITGAGENFGCFRRALPLISLPSVNPLAQSLSICTDLDDAGKHALRVGLGG